MEEVEEELLELERKVEWGLFVLRTKHQYSKKKPLEKYSTP